MKLSLLTTALLAASTRVVHGRKGLRDAFPDNRDLGESEYGFFVSHISKKHYWCITATNGVDDYALLGFEPCDFHKAPSNQLWRLGREGKIRSNMDYSKCMTVNKGKGLEPGSRIRMADCDLKTYLNKFKYDEDPGKLFIEKDDNFCVTNQGSSPQKTDTIHAEKCKYEDDFIFTYKKYDPSYESSDSKHSYHDYSHEPSYEDSKEKNSYHDDYSHEPSYEDSKEKNSYHDDYSHEPSYEDSKEKNSYHDDYSHEPSKEDSKEKNSYHGDYSHEPSYEDSKEKHSYHESSKHGPSYESSEEKHSYHESSKHSSDDSSKHSYHDSSKHSYDSYDSKSSYHHDPSHYSSDDYYDYFQLHAYFHNVHHACVVVKNAKPRKDDKLLLGECRKKQAWRLDDYGLFHSKLNDKMCMQVDRGDKPKPGMPIRMYPCDKKNKLQQFYVESSKKYKGDIKLKWYKDLCIDFRGINANVNEDPIIVKKCKDQSNKGWTTY